ncbi:hypothetical protein ACFL4T_05155 [candidate division KSB1 bacterium]
MSKQYIIVPVDGATNIKLEVLDFETLATVYSKTTDTPVTTYNGLNYNCTGEEFEWFDKIINEMPDELKNTSVIAPVSRGASGGLIGKDNSLCEESGKGLTLAYTQRYSEETERRFVEMAGSEKEFYLETGSVRALPGSLTLIKRFIFEEIERPETLDKAAAFGTYPILMTGHFLNDNYLNAVLTAGNEHSYWMCHAGARNINQKPGTLSTLAEKIESFKRLVPGKLTVCYNFIGKMPAEMSKRLGLSGTIYVNPGGHDTCLSHIPIMSTFYSAFQEKAGKPVIQIDAGTWTMTAQIGGTASLHQDGYLKDIIVQGTVDGEPVVTGKYAGGSDFKYVKTMVEKRGSEFKAEDETQALKELLSEKNIFIMPNINPDNHGTGPFPEIKGKIIGETELFKNPANAYIAANLTAAISTVYQLDEISKDKNIPLVITAGASKDETFCRIIASLTGRDTFTMLDKDNNAVTETTTLGAAVAGKASVLGIHPYEVNMNSLGIKYKKVIPFSEDIISLLQEYRSEYFGKIKENGRL